MAQVGEIVYQVQMDVRQLLTSQQQLEQRLNRMDSSFNRTSQSVNNTERSMQSLSKVAAALTGYLSASMVASYSEAWTELNNKLSNSVRASESLIDVTQRVFDISQATRSSLDATATLYARLERGTREYNTSAADLAKLTSIINQGFIVSGATAQEAENAIIQLSQGIASGVLRGEEFNSVAEQGSRLMVALADSMGVGIGQLRKMAAEGKLTTDVVVKGLLSQGDAIGKEFAKTTRTMSQAFQEAGNNLTKFLGENTTIKASINVFSDAVITVSKSLDELSSVLTVIAAVVGSRYVGALAMATKSKIMMAAASRQESVATLQSAKASEYATNMSVRKAQADLASARSAVALAQAEYNVAKGTLAEATALDNLIAKKTLASKAAITLTQATQAQTAAMANSAAAAKSASLSMGLLRGAMGMLGGPAGVAMLAGAAIYYFYQQSKEAREESNKFADDIRGLTEEYKKFSRAAKEAAIVEAKKHLEVADEEAAKLKYTISLIEKEIKELNDGFDLFGLNADKSAKFTDQLKTAVANLEKQEERRGNILYKIEMMQSDLNGTLKQGADLLQRESSILPNAKDAWNAYGFSIERATRQKKEFNAQSLIMEWSDKGLDLRKSLEREAKLANAKSEIDKRKLQVEFYAEDNGLSEQEVASLNQYAIAAQEAQDAAAERNKTTKESTKATDAAYEALKRQREEIELLNKGYKDGSLEMAKYDAVKALGDTASPKQIEKAEQLAEEKYNIQRAAKNKELALEIDTIRKLDEERKSRLNTLDELLASEDISFELHQIKRLEIASEYSRKIAEENAKLSANPIEDNRAQFDPVQQLKNENAKKLALMDKYYADEMAIINQAYANQQISHEQFTTAKQITDAQYLQIRTAQEKQFNEQQTAAQWQMLSQQSLGFDMLTSAVDAMAGSASNAITGLLTGTMTAADAMRSLGNTILNSVVNSIVQTGVEMLKNFIIGKTMGAAAAAASIGEAAVVASAWAPAAAFVSLATMGANAAPANASLVGTTGLASTLAISGARKNGGPVGAGSMYRVGEGGKPEIFKANNGRQYMIPGDNGKVISNKDMQGGGMNVNVVFNDYSSGGHKFDAQTSQDGNTLTVQAFIMDMDNKGPMLQSITRNTSATARARG
ncbi:tape measure protein [Proteus mirabilis]|uniref:Tape measure protein n=1 Tax=Proteus mirabilis TaxID=584 RepID=A0A7D5W524_PROMI|nr:tape measure protein [Proteus mirabilis]EKU0761704.1 tape measure protein [Proteus mirabilis]EKU5731783.1 tape measure protein [Proteus mirabilis]EKX9204799.1 tape measure protein [Proteus mirabilis]MBG2955608.1 tape measure protein [Proteus mirabilis]MCL9987223.1 tape measure protein [Proteus mirabilis]